MPKTRYKAARTDGEPRVLEWYGGYEAMSVTIPTKSVDVVTQTHVLKQAPRLVAGDVNIEPVAFPSGIARGRPLTIRRSIISVGIWDNAGDYKLVPMQWGVGLFKSPLSDKIIKDIPDSGVIDSTLSPLNEYRDAWFIHYAKFWTPYKITSTYASFRDEAKLDSSNMRKFEANDGLLCAFSCKNFTQETRASTMNLYLQYRFLVQW